MNKHISLLSIVVLLFSCTPEQSNPSGADEPDGGKDKVVNVTGISLDRNSVTIKEGESVTLVATVTPSNADNKTVTWSSSSDAVATVDTGGKVTGIKAGSATITAATEDGGKKAICSISVEANLAPSVTIEAKNVSAVSAVLAGKANLGSTVASDLKVGFQYSKSAGILPSNSTTIEATDADAAYNYTAAISGLDPNTKYYFRSFVRQNSQDTYGETKEFTTKDITSLLETEDASGVEATKATLNARLDLTDVQYESAAYGFLWGTSESALDTDNKCTEIKDNTISALLTNLSHKTQYWYKAYVKLDSRTFYGEVKTFTTDVVTVESVSLDKTEYTFNTIGNTLNLTATVLPVDATDKSIEWTSDKEDVAKVDANGKVTAKSNGTANITVKTKNQEKTAKCVITVAQWVTGISLDKTALVLYEGQEQTLIPTVNPSTAADKSLNWTSNNPSVVTVDAEGKVTAISKGTATIKAKAKDGSGKYSTCSVTVKRPVSSIELNKTSLVLYRGTTDVTETLTATVTPFDANNAAVTWTSSNTSVATVSNTGLVTGKARGTATIMVTANDGNGAQAICEVEVKQYVTEITLDKTLLSLVIGENAVLSVTSILPESANDMNYSWSSSDDNIATVDNNGKVTAKAKGNAIIKAMANDGSGLFASCSLFVIEEKVDMGIKTSNGGTLYWSSRNLCESGFVNNPEDYGDHYAWGETASKSNYSWLTYKFRTSGDSDANVKFSKYNSYSSLGTVDNKTVLDPEDDVAHVKLGDNWRLPTDEELAELMTKCTWSWTDNYNGTGGKGMIVTATNGNSIFLPAAGCRYNDKVDDMGAAGYYWSLSIYTQNSVGAWAICFDYGSDPFRYAEYRNWGLSVRPVTE